MKKIVGVHAAPRPHWVGDGFPVRSLFGYEGLGKDALSPFLLLDHAAPHHFEPAERPRGVGQHPHRGFETVTIVYQGELEHRDSTGTGGLIGPGDVQWMTAAGGILHEEFHSPAFTRKGGTIEMVQLWVNLPARDKLTRPGYQTLLATDIPVVELPGGAGQARVIAGTLAGRHGPARTFTPIDVWDLRLREGASTALEATPGHTLAVVVLEGTARFNGGEPVGEGRLVHFDRADSQVQIEAVAGAAAGEGSGEGDDKGVVRLLWLAGEPIAEPVVGYGPFVMNSMPEIHQAIADFNGGRFGRMPATVR